MNAYTVSILILVLAAVTIGMQYPRGRKILKWTGIILGGLVVLVVGSFIWGIISAMMAPSQEVRGPNSPNREGGPFDQQAYLPQKVTLVDSRGMPL